VLTDRQAVEVFHLLFLRALVAKGEDRSLFALKGGCNLRFFFGSIRYSEDMDLDVRVTSKGTLKNKVDRLLESPLLTAPLKSHGLDVSDASSPKQTETTQRWKVGLQRTGRPALRTKIEFSRRDSVEGAAFEAVPGAVLTPYGMSQVLATHYTTRAAVAQKVGALAQRAEPQARDVFDLGLLLARPDAAKASAPASQVRAAIENAMSLGWDEFQGQVVAYLEPEQAAPFDSKEAWNAMQDDVVARLEGLLP
jgi:predicted nucleotidyltransferase component of viral defense system